MKAIKVRELKGKDALEYATARKPYVKKGDVRIKVYASSVNPVDSKSIEKGSPFLSASSLPVTPGFDVAGIVDEVGKDVTTFKKGDKVYGQASTLNKGSGAYAEFAVTDAKTIAMMPENLDFVEAATVPLAACSAYEALHQHIELEKGQHILIHGGSGGIGSYAIQLAKHIGAYVATTATGEGIEYAYYLGADVVIDYKSKAFEEEVSDYDAVLDTVGNETYTRSFKVLKKKGILVSMLREPDESLMNEYDVNAVLEMTKVDRETLDAVTRLIENGVLKVVVSRTFPLDKTKDAFEAKDREKILGKIAIEVR